MWRWLAFGGVSPSVRPGTMDDGVGIGNGSRYRGITTQHNTTATAAAPAAGTVAAAAAADRRSSGKGHLAFCPSSSVPWTV